MKRLEKLRQLLQYMENSIVENAKTEGLQALHKMATLENKYQINIFHYKTIDKSQHIIYCLIITFLNKFIYLFWQFLPRLPH